MKTYYINIYDSFMSKHYYFNEKHTGYKRNNIILPNNYVIIRPNRSHTESVRFERNFDWSEIIVRSRRRSWVATLRTLHTRSLFLQLPHGHTKIASNTSTWWLIPSHNRLTIKLFFSMTDSKIMALRQINVSNKHYLFVFRFAGYMNSRLSYHTIIR